MENTETPTRGSRENHKTDPNMLIGSKPLHRFIRGEPRSLGVRDFDLSEKPKTNLRQAIWNIWGHPVHPLFMSTCDKEGF